MTRTKLVVFSLLPALLLLAGLELAARIVVTIRPSVVTLPLAPDAPGLFVPDPELFWAMPPHLDIEHRGVRIATNSLGLRSPEVGPKRPDELRILSLGESTTMGEGVALEQTYTAQLAARLGDRAASSKRTVTYVNAGVSAYSSFQGVRFLETTGVALQPDVVVVYFELNDSLPSSLRDAGESEIGLARTDRQLAEWNASRLGRKLADVSVLYRALSLRLARSQVESFDATDFHNPLLDIGLPDIGLQRRLEVRDASVELDPRGREVVLSPRVSEEERREHFVEMQRLARSAGAQLVVVHPSYRYSRPHECTLTRLAAETDMPLVDAHPALHPPGEPQGSMFLDFWHPNASGHARLAEALSRHLGSRGLVP